MANKHHSSTAIAFGGICAALCVVLMLTTALIPFATYALPALAGVILIPIMLELGSSTATVCYVAVSLLSLFIVPDKETALMFIGFFGYYPILKEKLNGIKFKPVRMVAKVLVFNCAMIISYLIVIYAFGLKYLISELSGWFLWVVIIIANIFFPVYELALKNVTLLYIYRIRKHVFKNGR